ncbi:unnamed protein product [Phytophthora fragariaefolia]|uniref:Unnamed protein product n=1 Tax=Phytophthora fragariaefolia TaxID=1490495 RepID=A0A9W6WT11_9STRA|nr:unnamed protein product [Phytophthora fragariaefolia]
MASSLKRVFGRQPEALVWRREVNRQQEIALKMTKEYKAVEKARRVNEHNDSLSRQEKASLPRPRINENSEDNPEDAEDTCTPVDESLKSLFEPGDRVWLYMERVEPGITKKLTHRWHGPFRVKKKVGEYASVREFLVKWVGYDEPTWEPMTNLSCEGLLYDYLRENRSSQRFQMVQVADDA